MLIPGKGMGVLQNSKKFRVRVESVLEVTEAPGIVARAHRTYTSSGYGHECRTELTEVPGTDLDGPSRASAKNGRESSGMLEQNQNIERADISTHTTDNSVSFRV